jgi:hypothetical protein
MEVTMAKKHINILSALLAIIMMGSVLTSCHPSDEVDTTDNNLESVSTHTDTSENISEEETEEDTSPKLQGKNAHLIENAERLKNGVQSYYSDPDRTAYTIENKNMTLDYVLTGAENQMVRRSKIRRAILISSKQWMFSSK